MVMSDLTPGFTTYQVTWAPEAIRVAVERATAILQADDETEVYRFGDLCLTTMDLACLIDAARTCLPNQTT